MASANGQTPDLIIDQLAENPHGFSFLRAVWLLECLAADKPPIGYASSPSKEPVRFQQEPSLAFATSTIKAFRPSGAAGVAELVENFLGLFGPHGPLPPHLTDYAYDREAHFRDRTFTAFCNVFHHRIISFFYRAWADTQKTIDLARPPAYHRFYDYLGSLLGTGMESLRDRDALSDSAKFFFAGRLACPVRNAEGLEAILRDFFRVEVELETFNGRWFDVTEDSICRLGESPETGSLGLTTLVGARFWDCQLSFRIKMGPLSLVDFQRFLPGTDSFRRLRCWIRNYCGQPFFWDLQLVLHREEVPEIRLGSSGQLGWTTWLKSQPLLAEADDLILIPPED